MFLGRSTIQWTALISAAVSALQVLIVTLVPNVDAGAVAVVLGTAGGFLGVLIAFIANTSTTPISDPQLKDGTMVRIVDATDGKTVIAHAPIEAPK